MILTHKKRALLYESFQSCHPVKKDSRHGFDSGQLRGDNRRLEFNIQKVINFRHYLPQNAQGEESGGAVVESKAMIAPGEFVK